MNNELVSKIVALFHGGASVRRISLSLGVSRRTVQRALGQVEQARGGGSPASAPRAATARASKLDAYEPAIADLLARYPDISVRRIHEELRPARLHGRLHGPLRTGAALASRSDRRARAAVRDRPGATSTNGLLHV